MSTAKTAKTSSVNGSTAATQPEKVGSASKVASKVLLQAVKLRKASRMENITPEQMALLQEDATISAGAWCEKEGVDLWLAHSVASTAVKKAKAHVESHNMWGEWL